MIPSSFFSDVLPEIADGAELIVTLYAFYVAGRKRGGERFFTDAELRGDRPLVLALSHLAGDSSAALRRGLDAAVSRGTLLRAVRRVEGRELRLYAVHMPGAAAMLGAAGAEVTPPDVAVVAPVEVVPNIFLLYEENIGVVSPLLAEQLRDAETEYPWPWIEAAFREAVALNKRNWRYIERILERWRTEGPDLEAIRRSIEGAGARRRSLAGRYWRLVRR